MEHGERGSKAETPCRIGGGTCGACCWGAEVPQPRLVRLLDRHRRSFARLRAGRRGPLALLLHELRARRGLDLVLAPLLWLPLLGDRVRDRLRRRAVCAFVAFEDEGRTRVGCAIHPTLGGGRDVRRRAAFRLLRGVGCGAADHLCDGARAYLAAPARSRAALRRRFGAMRWREYGHEMPRLRGDVQGGGAGCP